jgi:Kef-type K+ transport system membrane component KefB
MGNYNTEDLLIIVCSLVVLSYLFLIVSRYIRVPSVLLLLFAGVGFRYVSDSYGLGLEFPEKLVEGLGVVGLIMIVLEAGLDLKLARNKVKLIRNSFLSAFFILAISIALVTGILYYWHEEPLEKCLVYAIPLSIMSSSITLPSVHSLTNQKKEFLVYEASFSDILGIVLFNYFTADNNFNFQSLALFGGNIIVSVLLSVLLSFVLFLILAKSKMNIKFFLIFALLILIYAGGKNLHLPSLIIILVFGLMINNWEQIKWPRLLRYFPQQQVEPLRHLLHSLTAETAFLVRTFFFILFGYSITLDFFSQKEVWVVGGAIVAALFIIRLLYLRFFVQTNVFPESFFIPRGLITIVLFYKIPPRYQLSTFNNDILFFIILTTSFVMMLGMIFYKQRPDQVVEETTFAGHKEIAP